MTKNVDVYPSNDFGHRASVTTRLPACLFVCLFVCKEGILMTCSGFGDLLDYHVENSL